MRIGISKEAMNALSRISKIPNGTILSPRQVKGTETKLKNTKLAIKELSDSFEQNGIASQDKNAQKLASELKTREIFLHWKLEWFDKARIEKRQEKIDRYFEALDKEMGFIRRQNENISNIHFNI